MGLFYRNLKPKLSIFGARNRILFQKEFMHDSCIPVRGFPSVIGAKIEIIFFEGFFRLCVFDCIFYHSDHSLFFFGKFTPSSAKWDITCLGAPPKLALKKRVRTDWFGKQKVVIISLISVIPYRIAYSISPALRFTIQDETEQWKTLVNLSVKALLLM